MKILKIDNDKPSKKVIQKAAEVLTRGGLVVYPTDTAYGLGGNALDETVIKKVYKVKGRDFSKPTHVVVRDWNMINDLTIANNYAKLLYRNFLPGPLTLILSKKEVIPDILTANLPTLGVRIPNNKITQSLSQLLPFPYTTPSANRTGGTTPYSIEDAKNELDINKIDLILDAGKLPKTPPSTLVDLSKDTPNILREGPITESQIHKALKV